MFISRLLSLDAAKSARSASVEEWLLLRCWLIHQVGGLFLTCCSSSSLWSSHYAFMLYSVITATESRTSTASAEGGCRQTASYRVSVSLCSMVSDWLWDFSQNINCRLVTGSKFMRHCRLDDVGFLKLLHFISMPKVSGCASLSGPSASSTWKRSSSLCRTATPSWWPPCTRLTLTWSSGKNNWWPTRKRRRDWESRWAGLSGTHRVTLPHESEPITSSHWEVGGDLQDRSWLVELDVEASGVCHRSSGSSDMPTDCSAGLIQCWFNQWPVLLPSQSVRRLRQCSTLHFLLSFQWRLSSVGGVPALPLHGSSGISLDPGSLITNLSALQSLYPLSLVPTYNHRSFRFASLPQRLIRRIWSSSGQLIPTALNLHSLLVGARSSVCSFWQKGGARWLKMAHVSGVVWEGEGFVGQRYPTFTVPLRRKKTLKNHQRELLAAARFSGFLLRTSGSSSTRFKIIWPVSTRCRATFRGDLDFSFYTDSVRPFFAWQGNSVFQPFY